MLGIEINKEFLELEPGATMEMKRESPILQFNDTISGDYSMPVEVKDTPKNRRLLNFSGLFQTKIPPTGLEAKVWNNGEQDSIGKLKIEKVQHNLNRAKESSISCYYLTSLSSFISDIKNVRLRDVDFGGDRSFPFTGVNLSNPNSFWKHIHNVIDAPVGGYDYAFYPVINEDYGAKVMNKMYYDNYSGRVYFDWFNINFLDINAIVPFPYLKYVLQRVCAHIGYTLEGEILNDPDFVKATIVNFRSIDWAWYDKEGNDIKYYANVKFNVKDHLPNWSLSEFFINLRNRLGWYYDVDRHSKKITIKLLKDVVGASIKDFAKYAQPIVQKKVLSEKKSYSLKNIWAASYGSGQPDYKGTVYKGNVPTVADLPAVDDSKYGHVYLVARTNNLYVCRMNDSDNNLGWHFYTYNVYDYLPAGYTDEISSEVVTVGMDKSQTNFPFYDNDLQLLPRFDAPVFFPIRSEENRRELGEEIEEVGGMPLLFYHGPQPNGNGHNFPYGSSHVYNAVGQQVASWSLALECKTDDGREVGLYETFWRAILNTLNTSEEVEVTLNLPLTEYQDLKFSEVISINHVRLYIRNILHTIPFNKKVVLECSRI